MSFQTRKTFGTQIKIFFDEFWELSDPPIDSKDPNMIKDQKLRDHYNNPCDISGSTVNVIIFVFVAHKKYSRSFVKVKLNDWYHMDYFNDVLATFLNLERVRILYVYGKIRELSEFIKNILICVPKMNEGLTGLERYEGE